MGEVDNDLVANDAEYLTLGIGLKLLGCFFLALRFILLKKLDSEFDHVREDNPDIDQADTEKVYEILKKDVYFKDTLLAMHKYELYNYLTIPFYIAFDAGAIYFIPFTLFGVLNVASIIIYQLLLPPCLSDPVDWNEWAVFVLICISSYFVTRYSPVPGIPGVEVHDSNTMKWDATGLSEEPFAICFLTSIFVFKFLSYYYVQFTMDEMIRKKDEEIISDHYQPRPASLYNLAGPFHLACNGALFSIFIKALMVEMGHEQPSLLAYVLIQAGAVVFGGFTVGFLAAHGYTEIIAELHSATVFPLFLLLQSLASTYSGIILFDEQPTDPELFHASCGALFLCMCLFVYVMEINEENDYEKL